MPYPTLSELPDAVKKLPKHGQEIYQKAFNAAFKQYGGDETKSHATAWAAVKSKFKKSGDEWVAKEAVHPHGDHVCVCADCGKEVTVGVGVKCNTQKCPECGAPMTAKTAGENRESDTGEMSADDKHSLLQSALVDQYGVTPDINPDPTGMYIQEVFDDYIVYRAGEQLYKVGYTLAEDGTVTFSGEPEKVTRQTSYTPMESLQKKYADIVMETGRRNATLDSGRIKKAVELCQGLLSSEAPDEAQVKTALKEAGKAVGWLNEQALMKIEDNEKFTASAFAYTPDTENPDTWGVRLHETAVSGLTKQQLGKASASLSPGGYKGIKANIPESSRSDVMRKIRLGYCSLGIDESDIPKWVKAPETRERVLTYTPLTEAKFDKGRATVIVIKPGFNATEDRYYPAEMLKRDYGVFEGMKMYADHPTDEEDKARPERSIKDWVATLSDVTVDESGIVTGIAEVIEPWLMQKLASLREKEMLSDMGISINAVGSASKGTIDGKETLIIEKLVAARSVDFVTEPGAGGIVTFYESDRSRDVDLIELSGLREKRPDLVKLIEDAVKAEITREVKNKMELDGKVKELEGQVESLTTENTELKTSISEAEKAKAKAEAQAAIKEAVDKAEGLPDAAKARMIERFADAETVEGIEEAIQSEKDYIAKLSESKKVKDLGPSHQDPEASQKALRESFKTMHPEWTDAQLDIACKG